MEAGEAEVDLEAQEVRFDGRAVALRDRRRAPAPAARGPRRHRAHAPAGRRDRRLRARARARGARSRRRCDARIVTPARATASGPRSWPRPCACSTRSATSTSRSGRSAARPSTPTARRCPTRRSPRPRAADAVLLAAVGGPKWDSTDPAAPRPEQGLLALRKALGLYANLRPVRPRAGALRREPAQARADRGHRPARRARAHRRHLLRREDPHRDDRASDLCVYSVEEIERIARVAFRSARTRVTSIDKMNVLETGGCGARSWPACTPRSSRPWSSSTSSSTPPP